MTLIFTIKGSRTIPPPTTQHPLLIGWLQLMSRTTFFGTRFVTILRSCFVLEHSKLNWVLRTFPMTMRPVRICTALSPPGLDLNPQVRGLSPPGSGPEPLLFQTHPQATNSSLLKDICSNSLLSNSFVKSSMWYLSPINILKSHTTEFSR